MPENHLRNVDTFFYADLNRNSSPIVVEANKILINVNLDLREDNS